MIEALGLPFIQRAIVAGVVVAALAAYYGAFVVERKLSFLGAGLGHSAFGGVALGLLLGVQPLWIAIPFTVVVALGITWVSGRGVLSGDTAVGIFFAVAMALGVVFLSLKTGFAADAFAYLFGSILAVSPASLWVVGGIAVLTLAFGGLWPRWAYATFDRNLARADRLPVSRDDYLLSVLMAVTVVASVNVVGVVLVSAFLVIPAAAARLVTRTFSRMSLVAVAIGVVGALVGLAGSYVLDIPSGAAIVLVQALLFVVAVIFGHR